jgi:anthranilate synthase component I
MINPTREEFLAQIGDGKRIPLKRRIPADLETPVSAFLKLKPLGAAFLLESVEQGIQVGRYSFIGIAPETQIKLEAEMVEIRRGDKTERVPVDPLDPFRAVRDELVGDSTFLTDLPPGPFAGAIGYIGYDMVRYFESIPLPDDPGLGLPDYQFLFPETVAVFDHVKCEIEIITLPPEGDPESAYTSAVALIERLLKALSGPLEIEEPSRPHDRVAAEANISEEAFKEKVAQAKEHILAGDAFQIVLSRRLHGKTDCPPFQIYRALRILNPSPYMFFIDFDDWQVIGSSPEMLVKLEKRKATLCPIAGTRPRGDSPKTDDALAAELLACKKERAEHVMLVDLGRNDLGRVCDIGSVTCESLMQIERYSHVMHIVSRVTGTLRSDLDMFDLLKAAFPAGTVTGAPKVRAMEIISDLERFRRGPYAGAVGYLGRQGDMDMCITIRTLIINGDDYFAQAGAGIVTDSDPLFEFNETTSKIQAITRAIAIAEEGF